MTAVAVAMAEIVREGTWALRALGYPYGTAERAAGMLAWTEAVHGSGLTLLRLGEAAIIAGAARPQPRWSRDAEGGRLAEAQGKCLFECGPPALDLATADAKLGGGLGRAVLRGAIGTSLSGALGAMAAQRGLAAVVVYAPGAAEIVPVPPASLAWSAKTKISLAVPPIRCSMLSALCVTVLVPSVTLSVPFIVNVRLLVTLAKVNVSLPEPGPDCSLTTSLPQPSAKT